MDKTIARKIVANLAWRYRFARKCANKIINERYSLIAEAHKYEAWNAYIASKNMLYILDFEDKK